MRISSTSRPFRPPSFTAALREQLRRDVARALDAPDGVSELMTGTTTEVNRVLEELYGLPQTSSGPDDWRTVELDPARRVGILTHPLLMARFAHGEAASVILRGKFVYLNLLCGTLNPPPQGAAEEQANLVDPSAPPREQAEARLESPNCQGCHVKMDPIGFGFSSFDGGGRWLDDQDTAGEITSSASAAGTFVGPRELGERLAAAPETRACIERHFLRYTLGKTETPDEACSMAEVTTSLAAEHTSLIDLFAAATTVPAFTQRAAEAE